MPARFRACSDITRQSWWWVPPLPRRTTRSRRPSRSERSSMAEALPFHDEAADIVAEQVEAIARVDDRAVGALLLAIETANAIFLLGEGRSGLVGRMFAMRLMHLGKQAYVVGETITPAIGRGDLLIAISGSGETGAVVM